MFSLIAEEILVRFIFRFTSTFQNFILEFPFIAKQVYCKLTEQGLFSCGRFFIIFGIERFLTFSFMARAEFIVSGVDIAGFIVTQMRRTVFFVQL